MAGGLFEIGLSDMFSLQPELLYAANGADINQVGDTITYKFDYFEIPVLLKAKTSFSFDVVEVIPSIFAGPNFGFNINAEQENNQSGFITTQSLKSSTRSTNVALDFGGGVEIPLNPADAIFADARYSLGMTNIYSQNGASTKTRGIQFLAGLKFKI